MAQQEAERARFVEEKAEQQKKEAIISVEGDLKQAELIANSHATTTAIAGGDPAAQAGGRGGHRIGAAALVEHHLPALRAVGAPPAAPLRPFNNIEVERHCSDFAVFFTSYSEFSALRK